MKLSGEELLAAVAHGDEPAFAELYDRFAPRLLGLIVKILGSRRDADDVLQDVFHEIWCRADRYKPDLAPHEFWLIMLTRSRAIDHLRRRTSSVIERASFEFPTRESRGAKHDREIELAGRALAGLEMLPEEQRTAISLSFFRGLTGAQIADALGIPPGTVKTRIRLGVRKLRKYLEPHNEAAHP